MQTANPLEALKIERGLLERQTAAGYVADSLRAAIQTGALSDGMELNQVALAEHFGISRVPVREALRARRHPVDAHALAQAGGVSRRRGND